MLAVNIAAGGENTMETLLLLAEIAGSVTGITACACLIAKPLRNKVLGIDDIRKGQRCLLRSDMLHTYYKHREDNTIRQYEYENFVFLYEAYKALGGNSFIDHIYKEVQSWEVVT